MDIFVIFAYTLSVSQTIEVATATRNQTKEENSNMLPSLTMLSLKNCEGRRKGFADRNSGSW
jgi:hypothetical protein